MTRKRQSSPFGYYFKYLDDIDKGARDSKEFGSILILSLVEEVGENLMFLPSFL